MSVTIKDIAKAANVSISTVSKSLNNSSEISSSTIERIKSITESLGYLPNARAQSFVSKKTKNIVILADLYSEIGYNNPQLFEIICGIESALSIKGYSLSIKNTDMTSAIAVTNQIIHNSSADGIIFHPSIYSQELDNVVSQTEFPYVIIGNPNFKSHSCWIDSDNTIGGEIAAEHLIDYGYKRVVYLAGEKKDKISEHRLQGVYEKLSKSRTTELVSVQYGDSTCQSSYLNTEMLIYNNNNKVDAIICANNYIAYGCVSALENNNIRIPLEMGIVTFDDFPFSMVLNVKLTVIDIDMREMGKQAGKLILSKIKKPNLYFQSYSTVPKLIIRESTKNHSFI